MSRRRQHLRRDDGASLVIALAFVTIVAVGATALLTLADTGLRTSQAIRTQGYELHSANGAVERAVTTVRRDLTTGRHLGPCPTTSTTLNGVVTEVTCVGAPGSGGGGPSSSLANTPPNAVLTTATGAEDGLVQRSNNVLRIQGPVTSNSTVRVNVSSALLNVDGPVVARGNCSATVVSMPAPSCNRGAGSIDNGDDPDYAMHPAAPTPVPPALAPEAQGCLAGGGARLVRFFPGKYDSAAQLNQIFLRCNGGLFHFEPGFYYFDFPSSDPVWRVTGSATRVVGGVPARWAPSVSAAPGTTGVTAPFPDDSNPLPDGGCVTSSEVPTTPGVQFAFGGHSRLFVQDAKVELCARGNNTEQQIAIYGITPARDTTVPPPPPPTPTSTTRTSTGPAQTSGDPTYADPDNALAIDGASAIARATGPRGTSQALLTIPGLTGAPIPPDASIDSVRLHVIQRPENDDVRGITARLTSGPTTLASVGSRTGGCNGSTSTAICQTPTATAWDQKVSLPGSYTPAQLNVLGLTLTLETTLRVANSSAGVHHVDYLGLEVTFTPAPTPPTDGYKQVTGCAAAGNGCPLLETVGGPTALAVHGTFYAPTAALQLELTNVSAQVLRRGVIARTARLAVTGSSSFLGSPISLPPLTGAPGNREVLFTARQGGTDVLRAVVTFDDTGTVSADRRADVKSWSVLR